MIDTGKSIFNTKFDKNNEQHAQINYVLENFGKRIEAIEKALEGLPTPDKVFYKPKDHEKYLNIKENYDEIYRRLEVLEGQAHPAPRTDHGKRLTALEEKVDGMQG
tara:strand:+ start:641 stop:958 length:318 start_codon:yes stop_codon:yes gene_type:complete